MKLWLRGTAWEAEICSGSLHRMHFRCLSVTVTHRVGMSKLQAGMKKTQKVRQCIGRTKNRTRCQKHGRYWLRWFCDKHRWQPLKFLIALVAFVGSVAGILQCADSAKNSRKLDALLARVRATESTLYDRLKEVYPLGYCAFGLAGDKVIVLPPRHDMVITGDWSGIYIESVSADRMGIVVPYLKDIRFGNEWTDVGFGVDLRPGFAKTYLELGNLRIAAQCLQTSPTGYVCVLGFDDPSARK
jgi:hypothetical protein